MNFREKIIPIEQLAAWRTQIRKQGKGLVVTNGVFDLLHLGHVSYLQDAHNQGDMLLVGLTSDAEVHRLKGPTRPLNTEQDRAAVLAALQSVDAVCIFNDPDARPFLALAEPDIYVKGGDYTIDTINQDERRFLEKRGTKIIILPGVPGKSTTGLLEKIAKL
jgi:D-glycero-beta-D-manno-heptose 1-phosphate adenylyltransferase